MIKITIEIEGMKCPMCEKHTNEAISKAFNVSKVTSFHKENKTEILTEADIPDDKLREALADTGYTVGEIAHEEVKKSIFSIFKK